jgi:hypothetical protein
MRRLLALALLVCCSGTVLAQMLPMPGSRQIEGGLGHINRDQSWFGKNTFSNTILYPAASTGTQVSCLGLDASNNVVKNAAACGSGGAGAPVKGTVLPSSVYLGGASGNLSSTFFVPTTNTNGAGAIEGIGVVASLSVDAPAVLQFNMPEVIPSGTLKLRVLAWTTNTTNALVSKLTVKDANVAAGNSLGTSTLNTESQLTVTWTATADIMTENKITLTSTPAANDVLTVLATFNSTGWTLATASVWQFSIVWE